MLFNSIPFLLFFPVVCVVFYCLRHIGARNIFLLLASYYFYMNWEPVYALLLLSSTVITYLAALGMNKCNTSQHRKIFLVTSIILNLGILFFFKYWNFLACQLTLGMESLGVAMSIPKFSILLPVGISFYTFQALGYSIDVFRKEIPVEKNFFTYALFVSFFPQLVAGPIERSKNLLPQFKKESKFSYDNVMAGVNMMLWGYFLKLCMADRCGMYIDAVYENLEMHNGGSYLLASLLFPFQIYGDFAGYSLIAIGVAKIMGFKLMENFHRPYFSQSVGEFWHRWHISLSTWFKDYVYIPLGGNRVGKARCYFNLMVTFVVSGIWHGANWTFLAWGTIHGALLCIEKAVGWGGKPRKGIIGFCRWLITFIVVCLAWIFFRADNINDALSVIHGIFFNFGTPFLRIAVLIAAFLSLAIMFVKEICEEFELNIHVSDSKYWLVRHLYIVFMIAYIILLGVLNGDQFIYFQF